jgi:hypothetical protein
MAMVVGGYRPITHLEKKIREETRSLDDLRSTTELLGATAAAGGRPIPPVLLSLMIRCWGESATRPSFDEIVTELRTLLFERQRQLRLSSVVSSHHSRGRSNTPTSNIQTAEALAASSALLRTSRDGTTGARRSGLATQDAVLLGDLGSTSNIRSTIAEEDYRSHDMSSNLSNHSSDLGGYSNHSGVPTNNFIDTTRRGGAGGGGGGGYSSHGRTSSGRRHSGENSALDMSSSTHRTPGTEVSESSLLTVMEGPLNRISDLSVESGSSFPKSSSNKSLQGLHKSGQSLASAAEQERIDEYGPEDNDDEDNSLIRNLLGKKK